MGLCRLWGGHGTQVGHGYGSGPNEAQDSGPVTCDVDPSTSGRDMKEVGPSP